MYKLSVPVMIHERFSKEETLAELKRCKADRVFLAIDKISFDTEKRNQIVNWLREYVLYFQQNGIETGIWFWTFLRSDECSVPNGMTLMKNAANLERNGIFCPSDERFVLDTLSYIRELASLNPDILMFDDDYRYSWLDKGGLGCYCNNHIKMVEEKLSEKLTRKQLFTKIYAGGPNRYREAWLEALGESLEKFAIEVRKTVDSVNENIRFACCSVMSLWDIDGIDSIKIAKILAGKTKPLLRLIGAPYWETSKAWGNRLQNVIELERMEYSWCEGENLEVMTEGDVYPRPRHKCPASYLEGFDTALRSAGVADGIHKYMLDYTSSPRYESGYIDRHVKNKSIYEKIPELFSSGKYLGVRVYEKMKKFKNSDLSDTPDAENYALNLFFSKASRLLADNTIPTTYSGTGMTGIAFGENARYLPDEAYDHGLILDIRAAKILMQKGIDVGIEKIGSAHNAPLLFYPEQKEYVTSGYSSNSAFFVTTKNAIRVLTVAKKNNEEYADAFLYKNKNGQRFLVFAFDAYYINEDRYRTYCMQKLLFDSIEWLSGKKLPIKCSKNPDCYIICKQTIDGMAIGIWNFSADNMPEQEVILDKKYRCVETVYGIKQSSQDKMKIPEISPFSFVFFKVKP